MNSRGASIRNIPNILTFARIASSFLVVLMLSSSGWWRIAGGILFLAASLTDLLDGYIARARGEVTELGKLADPLADKVLLLSGVLPLVEKGEIPSWLAMVLFAREFAVMGLRCVAASKGKVIPADATGKLKTAVYTISITLLIFGARTSGILGLYTGVVVSLLSAANYFARNLKFFEEGGV